MQTTRTNGSYQLLPPPGQARQEGECAGECDLVGTPAALAKAAEESERRCMKGASASKQIFVA